MSHSRSTVRWVPAGLAVLLIAAAAIVAAPRMSDASHSGAGGRGGFDVDVLVITMFDAETRPWLENEKLPVTINIPGAYGPVRCNRDGMCVLTTGMGKSNAAATMTAVLDSPRLDLRDAYFLSAGIAGTPPSNGTLGMAAWAHWVVDYDLGHHLLTEEAPDVPHGYVEFESDTAAYRLDDDLVDMAYDLTKDLELTDSERSKEVRKHYPGQAGREPYVDICDTETGDNYWSGAGQSARADYIMNLRTDGDGDYCTTQMEDNATATALARRGHLDRYLNLRTVSNFDQPYPGQTVSEHLSTNSGAFVPSVQNAYLVGSTVAHELASR